MRAILALLAAAAGQTGQTPVTTSTSADEVAQIMSSNLGSSQFQADAQTKGAAKGRPQAFMSSFGSSQTSITASQIRVVSSSSMCINFGCELDPFYAAMLGLVLRESFVCIAKNFVWSWLVCRPYNPYPPKPRWPHCSPYDRWHTCHRGEVCKKQHYGSYKCVKKCGSRHAGSNGWCDGHKRCTYSYGRWSCRNPHSKSCGWKYPRGCPRNQRCVRRNKCLPKMYR